MKENKSISEYKKIRQQSRLALNMSGYDEL